MKMNCFISRILIQNTNERRVEHLGSVESKESSPIEAGRERRKVQLISNILHKLIMEGEQLPCTTGGLPVLTRCESSVNNNHSHRHDHGTGGGRFLLEVAL